MLINFLFKFFVSLKGYEVAGIIDDLCSTVDDNKFVIGDRVVVYSDSDEISESGYVSIIFTLTGINYFTPFPIL